MKSFGEPSVFIGLSHYVFIFAEASQHMIEFNHRSETDGSTETSYHLMSIIFCVSVRLQWFDMIIIPRDFSVEVSGQHRRHGTYQRFQDILSSWDFLCYGNSANKSVWAGIISNVGLLPASGSFHFDQSRGKKHYLAFWSPTSSFSLLF